MAKRKKNRKNRKCRLKKIENIKSKESAICSPERKTTNIDECLNSRAGRSVEKIAPLSTPSPQKVTSDNSSPIRSTPVNRKHINRDEKYYESLNVTNLNILFDSKFVFNSTKSGSDTSFSKNGGPFRNRSHSSIPKFNSPGKEKPHVHQTTQTYENVEPRIKNCNETMKTPKMSSVFLLRENPVEKSFPILNKYKLNNDSSRRNVHGYEVNINPYMNTDIKLLRRGSSYAESSFFSPVSQIRSSSTPIEKVQTATEAFENVVDCSFNVDKLNNLASPITPKFEPNLNLNNNPLSDKVINKEESIRSLRMHTFNISKRKSYRTFPKSPTSQKNTISKTCNKRQHFSYSRLDISRRSSFDVTSPSLINPGTCEKVFMRLKRYCQASHNWPAKIFEICSQLGIQLKNSLSSLCTNNDNNSILEVGKEPTCKCAEYKDEICNLNMRISGLAGEVKSMKLHIEQQKNYKQDIQHLNQELKMIREELNQFKELRTELESAKKRFTCTQAVPATFRETFSPENLSQIPVPPPQPPPPPPPPLPLLPPAPLFIRSKSKTTNQCNIESKDNSRPVISLDDILKVKLKKTSDRNFQTPINRRNPQPAVSMDMLRQVKLKPTSRSSIRSETPDVSSDLTTSPHSSLCRLLKNDCSMTRLKRLRKVGGLSYDSFYRRNMLAKRDRDIS